MSDSGVILNFYKELCKKETDKRATMKALFSYILERKPSQKEIVMLTKLIKDFDYDIVFEALVSVRYSEVDLNGNYWGYVIAVCKNMLKESSPSSADDNLARETQKLLASLRKG